MMRLSHFGAAAVAAGLLMLAGCSGRLPQKVDFPRYAYRSDTILELVSVERTGSATVLVFEAFFNPQWYINISPDAYLTDGENHYALTGSEDITPGSDLYMDANGRARFKLLFEPLPSSVRDISLIEQENAAYSFNFYHIDLRSPKTIAKKGAADQEISRQITPGKLPAESHIIQEENPQIGSESENTTVEVRLLHSPAGRQKGESASGGQHKGNPVPAGRPKGNLTLTGRPKSTPVLAGLPTVRIALYGPALEEDLLSVLDEYGSATFTFNLDGPTQVTIELGNGQNSDPITVEPGSHVIVTVDGSSRELTSDRFSLQTL